MKRTLAMLLVLVMVAFAAVSCGAPAASEQPASQAPASEAPASQGGDAPDSQAPASEAPAASADTEGKKIGVIFYSKDDSLGAAVYSTLNYAAEALGVELVWKVGDLDPTAQITAAENMVAAGCNGILCIPMTDTVTQKIGKLCEDNQVYYVNCFRTITDDAIRKEVESYKYFLGYCFEDEIVAGETVVKLMADAGKKNAAIHYMYPGSALTLRNNGFDQGLESTGMNKIAENTLNTSGNVAETTSVTENFINTYSELDVIIAASSAAGQGEAMVNTIRNLAPNGKVQLATFDVFAGMDEAFKDGTLGCAVAGMSPDALFSFMLLYNAVIGMPLSDKQEELSQNYIYITSPEESEAYEKYIDNPEYMIYKAEDIQAMSRANNPDFDIEALRAIMADYTMENVIAKAEG